MLQDFGRRILGQSLVMDVLITFRNLEVVAIHSGNLYCDNYLWFLKGFLKAKTLVTIFTLSTHPTFTSLSPAFGKQKIQIFRKNYAKIIQIVRTHSEDVWFKVKCGWLRPTPIIGESISSNPTSVGSKRSKLDSKYPATRAFLLKETTN